MFWIGLLIRYGLPILIKSGVLNDAEAELVKAWYWAKKNVKTFHEYHETEGQKAAAELAPGTTNTNLTVGQEPDDDQFPKEVHST